MDSSTTSTIDKKPGIIRRLYNWTISWAERPGATWALFIIAFAESSFFPIPPDVLLVALCFGAREKWLKYVTICTLGSVLGAVFGWYIGWGLWETVQHWLIPHVFSQEKFETVAGMYEENALMTIFTAAFTVIPFKVFTVAAGVFGVSIPLLVLGSIIGRGFRFLIVAGIIRIFGQKIRPFVEKYLEICFFVGGALVVALFIGYKLLH